MTHRCYVCIFSRRNAILLTAGYVTPRRAFIIACAAHKRGYRFRLATNKYEAFTCYDDAIGVPMIVIFQPRRFDAAPS